MESWSLAQLLDRDPEEVLPTLREGFAGTAGGNQIAVHEPPSQRPALQLLADNRHTPYQVLAELGRSEDRSLRFRVGRNPVTPEPLIRELAADRYADVVAGVASNPAAPPDVLYELSRDPRATVRRAAAENPSTPRRRPKGVSPQLDRDARVKENTGGHTEHTLVASDPHEGSATAGLVPTSAPSQKPDRPWSPVDTRWLLVLAGYETVRDQLPEPSRYWAWRWGRSLDLPEGLTAALDKVLADLMRPDRPAWLRQYSASSQPITDPSVRDQLLNDFDPEIRWSTLCRSVKHPDDALGELLTELALSQDARVRLLSEGDSALSDRVLAKIDEHVLEVVAAHPSTPPAALRSLSPTSSPKVLLRLAQNPALPHSDLTAVIQSIPANLSVSSREWLAAQPDVPDDVSMVMSADKAPRVRLALAQNRDIPDEVSIIMSTDRAPRVRLALAENRSASRPALSRLASDRDRSIRIAALENQGTPPEDATTVAKELLASSADRELYDILALTAKRDDLSLEAPLVEDALDRLSRSRVRDPDMRRVVARDRRAGEATLRRLAKSADLEVRLACAMNERTPMTALEILATDSVDAICSPAARRLGEAATSRSGVDAVGALGGLPSETQLGLSDRAIGTDTDSAVATGPLLDSGYAPETADPAEELDDVQPEGAGELFMTRQFTEEELWKLATDKRAEKRMIAAEHPAAPPELLTFLAGERRSVQVKRVVAANPNTPPPALRSLADTDDYYLHQSLAFNTSTPADVLIGLADRKIGLAILVALNPEAPKKVLDRLAEDDELLVRLVARAVLDTRAMTRGAIETPRTSRPVLEDLEALDEDR